MSKPNHSKYWPKIVASLERHFPKGLCKERGRALVLIAEIEMMLQGKEIDYQDKGYR